MAETQPDPILRQLSRLRHGYRSRIFLAGVVGTVGIFVWLALIFVLGDMIAHFGPVWCWAAWGGTLATLLAAVTATLLWYRRPLSDENLCTRVEGVSEGLQNRLINYVQFARSPDPARRDFARCLYMEKKLAIGDIDAGCLFPRRFTGYLAIALAVALALLLGLTCLQPQATYMSLLRLCMPMAGVQPYTLTQILSVKPGTQTVARGASAEVTAAFSGVLPQRPVLHLRGGGGADQVSMAAIPGRRGRFAVRTPVLLSDVSYWVTGGDAESETFRITVSSPPALGAWHAEATPPAYTGLTPLSLDDEHPGTEVPLGSELHVEAEVSQPLARARLYQEREQLTAATPAGERGFSAQFQVTRVLPVRVELRGTSGLSAEVELPMAVVPDQSPVITFAATESRVGVEAGEPIALAFSAHDDYGVARVGVEEVKNDAAPNALVSRDVSTPGQQLEDRLVLEPQVVALKPGEKIRVRLWAEDNGPQATMRRGRSRVLELFVPLADESATTQQEDKANAEATLGKLIQAQQDNLKAARSWEAAAARKQAIPESARGALLKAQTGISELARSLLQTQNVLGDLQAVLADLVEGEMSAAVDAFAALFRAPAAEQLNPLTRGVEWQVKILAALQGVAGGVDHELAHQDRADLLAALQRLVAVQRDNLKATKAAQDADLQGEPVRQLSTTQDHLAQLTALFLQNVAQATGAGQSDDFAAQLREVDRLLREAQLDRKMLLAAGQIEALDWAAAVQTEELCLKTLMAALNVMNTWRVKQAQKTVDEAMKVLDAAKETLDKLEDRQSKIAEATRDLTKRGELDEKVRDELGKMDEEQKEWLDLVEELAQDLYQFPELPVSSELNSKMREIYEDVEQALDSENAPAVEIAVQKEDALLDAIRNAKERVEDVEMWLPDVPDNIKWDMETFDAAEFPEMPLVPLPDELEDIVGELLDQAADIDAASQDSTGNNMMADAEMGWGVMDGPMPNFSAKGKSGNARPNDNEMTGRSGAGREGQSNGELVEDHVKGLEGRETHARRTRDPLQSGQVTEDEDSTMTARATGGGKLGGESETDGFFGDAPRRDLQMQGPGKLSGLRQETEAMYATARLLYLGNTRALGAAARGMRVVERPDAKLQQFSSLQQRVAKRLKDSYAEINDGVVMPLPVSARTSTGGAAAGEDVDLESIDKSYRGVIADYYRTLGN